MIAGLIHLVIYIVIVVILALLNFVEPGALVMR